MITQQHFKVIVLASLLVLVIAALILSGGTATPVEAQNSEALPTWYITDPVWCCEDEITSLLHAAGLTAAEGESTPIDLAWFKRHTSKRDMHFSGSR